MYDVIIIGAGPAGISASLYAIRANLKVLVIYKEKSNLEKAEKIENYYGFKNGIKGAELYNEGIKQAINLGVETKKEEVIKIEKKSKDFVIKTPQNEYNSKVVILATGNKRNKPKINRIDEFEGKGISYCAVCDGMFYRDKDVAVIGNGNYAISEINELINLVKKIKLLTNGAKAPDFRAENVEIDTRKINAINGKNTVEEVEFNDGEKIKTNGVFIAEGVASSTDFARKLGAIIKRDMISVNDKMETNIEGLYACGDCTGGLLQVSKAVYQGTIAGLEAITYIRNLNKEE